MATSEGIPSSIDIEFLELNDNPYIIVWTIIAEFGGIYHVFEHV